MKPLLIVLMLLVAPVARAEENIFIGFNACATECKDITGIYAIKNCVNDKCFVSKELILEFQFKQSDIAKWKEKCEEYLDKSINNIEERDRLTDANYYKSIIYCLKYNSAILEEIRNNQNHKNSSFYKCTMK